MDSQKEKVGYKMRKENLLTYNGKKESVAKS